MHTLNEVQEEGMVNIMGGTVIETESDKIKIRTIIELGQEISLEDSEEASGKNYWVAFNAGKGVFGTV